jgi:aminoglycoside phosphotransferase (APT) family kinase protein
MWSRQVAVQRAAAAAGVAPRVVHVDAETRVVVSEHIDDRGWPAYYATPATHDAAITLLGEAIRRLHTLPLPADLPAATAHAFLRRVWQGARDLGTLPSWAAATLSALHEEPVPASDRAPVVSHNDLNPSNLRYDGARLLFLDWQTVSANDPYYDLALVSVFQRMDAMACAQLLSAYAGAPVRSLPPRFVWSQRFAAALSGTALLWVAGVRGYRGHEITPAQAPTLLEVYGAMRNGTLSMDTGEGQWQLGLALHRVAAA